MFVQKTEASQANNIDDVPTLIKIMQTSLMEILCITLKEYY